MKRTGTATFVLAMLCGGVTALPATAGAQAAGGSEARTGVPVLNNAPLGDTVPPPEPPKCIHLTKDLRRSSNIDDNQLTTWLSVREPAKAVIAVGGTASGLETGTVAVTVKSNGIPVANSQEVRGIGIVYANTSASVNLAAGRQYKFTAKATVSNKRLDLFDMYVAVGRTCP